MCGLRVSAEMSFFCFMAVVLESQDCQADVLTVNSFNDSRPQALDVSLVHPLQPSLPIAGVTSGKVTDLLVAVPRRTEPVRFQREKHQ